MFRSLKGNVASPLEYFAHLRSVSENLSLLRKFEKRKNTKDLSFFNELTHLFGLGSTGKTFSWNKMS